MLHGHLTIVGRGGRALPDAPRPGSALLATGLGWFGVMALTHFFESFWILPAFGWDRPNGAGHLIDSAAALLGIAFVTSGFPLRRLTIIGGVRESHQRDDA